MKQKYAYFSFFLTNDFLTNIFSILQVTSYCHRNLAAGSFTKMSLAFIPLKRKKKFRELLTEIPVLGGKIKKSWLCVHFMNQFYHHKTSVLLSGNMLNSTSQLAGIFRFKELCHKKWGINWQQKKIRSRSREEMRQFASGIHRYFLTVKTWQDFNSSGLLSTLQCAFLYQTYAFALFSPLKTLSYPQRTFSP